MHTNLFNVSHQPPTPAGIRVIEIGGAASNPPVRVAHTTSNLVAVLQHQNEDKGVLVVDVAEGERLCLVEDPSAALFQVLNGGKEFRGFGYLVGWDGEKYVETALEIAAVNFIGN